MQAIEPGLLSIHPVVTAAISTEDIFGIRLAIGRRAGGEDNIVPCATIHRPLVDLVEGVV